MSETMYLGVTEHLDPQSPEYKLWRADYKGGKAQEVKETSQERAAAEIAMKRYKRYADVYRPFEEAAFKEMTSKEGADRFEAKVKGQMSADAAQAMGARTQTQGIDPSRGTVKAGALDRGVAQAAATSQGAAEGIGRNQQIAGLQAAVNVGTGQANQTQMSYDELAGTALGEAVSKQEQKFNEQAARTNAIATGVGMAGRAAQGFMQNTGPAVSGANSQQAWEKLGRGSGTGGYR